MFLGRPLFFSRFSSVFSAFRRFEQSLVEYSHRTFEYKNPDQVERLKSQMTYINIGEALELRDGAGKLHAVIGRGPEESWIWRSKKGDRIVQCALFPNQRLVVTRFTGRNNTIRFLDEQVIPLVPDDNRGG